MYEIWYLTKSGGQQYSTFASTTVDVGNMVTMILLLGGEVTGVVKKEEE